MSSPLGRSSDALRRPADPPRVEQAGARAVVAVETEVERAGAFDEERPPLGEERFERGEVDDRRIRFDLAEVRVDGAGEREARASARTSCPGRAAPPGSDAFTSGLPSVGCLRQVGHRVRHQLEPLGRRGHRQSAELAERRHVAVAAARQQRPGRRFRSAGRCRRATAKPNVLACDGLKRSCENGMRNSAVQPLRIARHRHVPHRVPAVVAVVVVVPVAIDLHAGRD